MTLFTTTELKDCVFERTRNICLYTGGIFYANIFAHYGMIRRSSFVLEKLMIFSFGDVTHYAADVVVLRCNHY